MNKWKKISKYFSFHFSFDGREMYPCNLYIMTNFISLLTIPAGIWIKKVNDVSQHICRFVTIGKFHWFLFLYRFSILFIFLWRFPDTHTWIIPPSPIVNTCPSLSFKFPLQGSKERIRWGNRRKSVWSDGFNDWQV
jgi:hypothetical protein